MVAIWTLLHVPRIESASKAQCIADGKRINAMKTGMAWAKPGYWTRLNDEKVCIIPQYDSPGTFSCPFDGFIGGIKLVHLYGKITCDSKNRYFQSKWGCNKDIFNPLGIFITDIHKRIIFNRTGSDPPGNVRVPWYSSELFDGSSEELVFNRMNDPVFANSNSKFFVWYGEDLINRDEQNNGGKTCIDVYAHFV